MRRALGRFIQFETNLAIAERYEALFGSALDAVELALTEVMSQHDVPLEVIGAAIQMWVDFRVAWGLENPLDNLVEAAMQLEELEERFYSD
ncbi:MAG: hypothetical protein B6243_13520 [Anaerolineaceae bacterium 4572_5.2]|nr:MAG: hypothetical protein B6243_13520 [Anaerolineaceae bacterium 4572_5.2]